MQMPRPSSGAAKSAALLLFLLGTAGAVTLALEPRQNAAKLETLDLVTATGVHGIEIEVADTPEKQALGLMFRTALADNAGMLFTHGAPSELTMWMRNTYIPLDMVFIRADGTVHRIEARTEPLSERIITSGGPVIAVLELAGGAAERLGLKPGDKVRHPVFEAGRR